MISGYSPGDHQVELVGLAAHGGMGKGQVDAQLFFCDLEGFDVMIVLHHAGGGIADINVQGLVPVGQG